MTATQTGVVEGKLSPKQQRFVEEYLVDLNAKQAAIRAEYSPKTAESQGSRLLSNAKVSAAISALRDAESKKLGITRERVLTELARVAFFDIRKVFRPDGGMIAPTEWDDDTAAGIASCKVTSYTPPGDDSVPEYTKEIKATDKVSVLKDLARHLGVIKPEEPENHVHVHVEMPSLDELDEKIAKWAKPKATA